MLYTILDLNLVLADNGRQARISAARSSNPYDYIGSGYFLDNARLFGGQNYVNYTFHHQRHPAGNRLYTAD